MFNYFTLSQTTRAVFYMCKGELLGRLLCCQLQTRRVFLTWSIYQHSFAHFGLGRERYQDAWLKKNSLATCYCVVPTFLLTQSLYSFFTGQCERHSTSMLNQKKKKKKQWLIETAYGVWFFCHTLCKVCLIFMKIPSTTYKVLCKMDKFIYLFYINKTQFLLQQ